MEESVPEWTHGVTCRRSFEGIPEIVLFGSVENNDSQDDDGLRQWSRKRFETLRWKYHAPLDRNYKNNGFPKAMLDWSGIRPSRKNRMWKKVFSIHRPDIYMCRDQADVDFRPVEYNILTLNHYLGSWERFSARKDSRRSKSVRASNQFSLVCCRFKIFTQ